MDETLRTGLALMGLIGGILILAWAWKREDDRDDADWSE